MTKAKAIGEFGKPEAKAVRRILEEAMTVIDDDHGLKIEVKAGTYNKDVISFKVEITRKGGLSKEAADFIGHANVGNIPFDADDLNTIFKYRGEDYTLTGYRARARKQPILIGNLKTGKEYIVTIDHALKLIGREIKITVGKNLFGDLRVGS